MMTKKAVVLDTNIFVAAAFNSDSASARIIDAVRQGRLRMVWSEETRRETEKVLRQIPPISWQTFAALFREDDRYTGALPVEAFDYIPDATDRKFAALAKAEGGVLVTQDNHLLAYRSQGEVRIVTATEFQESFDS
jgi:predicted nucleic acid-binding protein